MPATPHYWVNQFAVAPRVPGGTRHYDFARYLGTLGLSVDIVASDLNLTTRRYDRRRGDWDIRARLEEVDGVRFRWLPAFVYESNDWRRYLNMLRFAQAAFTHLLRVPVTKETLFLGSSPSLLAAQAAQAAARVRGVRFALEVRDLWPESLVEMTGRETTVSRGLRQVADHLYRAAETIVVLAAPNAAAIAARGADPDRIVYIPNGVDLDRFPPVDHSGSPAPGEKFVAVYTGAHGPANDLDIVLDAAKKLQEYGDQPIEFLLVGDGVEKQRLIERARSEQIENVSFHDPVPKAEIPALLGRCHLGVHTLKDLPIYRTGVSPNKLFDYMAASLPVVTNVAGECADIVRHAGAGEVASPADAHSLANVVAEMAARPDRASLGANGRCYIAEHHSRDRFVEELAQVFRGSFDASA